MILITNFIIILKDISFEPEQLVGTQGCLLLASEARIKP